MLNGRNNIGSFSKATNHFDIKVEFLVTFIENWNCLLTYFYSFSYHLKNKSFTQEQCQADTFKKRKLIGEKYFTRNISLKFMYTTMQCIKDHATQLAITCSKFTIETLGQSVKYVQSYQ